MGSYEEKPIESTGSYHIPDDDLLVEDFDQTQVAEQENGLMEQVIDGFQILLEKQRTKLKDSLSGADHSQADEKTMASSFSEGQGMPNASGAEKNEVEKNALR